MKNCPWCKEKAVVKNSPLGFYAECSKNGHVHNIGVFGFDKSFCKTEKEAIEVWDEQVQKFENN